MLEQAITSYVEETLDLSGDDSTTIIDVGNATHIGIEIEGPTGTPTHVGTLIFEECHTDTPKTMGAPSVSFTAGNVVSKSISLPEFCFASLRVSYVHGSGGSGETCTIRVRAKRPW